MRGLGGVAVVAAWALSACSSFEAAPAPASASGDGGATSGGADAGEQPRRGLVLALDFDDDDPSVAKDSSGLGNHASVFGGARVEGVHGRALDFAAAGAEPVSVSIPSSPSLDIAGTELTIAFFVSVPLPLLAHDQVLIGKVWTTGSNAPPWYQYGVELNMEGKDIELFVGEGADPLPPPRAAAIPAFGTFTHVAFVVGGGTATAYVNGLASAPQPMTIPISARGTALALGVDATGGQAFGGILDEVRIFDRALDAEEIRQLAAR